MFFLKYVEVNFRLQNDPIPILYSFENVLGVAQTQGSSQVVGVNDENFFSKYIFYTSSYDFDVTKLENEHPSVRK